MLSNISVPEASSTPGHRQHRHGCKSATGNLTGADHGGVGSNAENNYLDGQDQNSVRGRGRG